MPSMAEASSDSSSAMFEAPSATRQGSRRTACVVGGMLRGFPPVRQGEGLGPVIWGAEEAKPQASEFHRLQFRLFRTGRALALTGRGVALHHPRTRCPGQAGRI